MKYWIWLGILISANAVADEPYRYDPARMQALIKVRCQELVDKQAVIEKRERLGHNQRWDQEKMSRRKAELREQYDRECTQPLAAPAAAPAGKPRY